LSGLSVKESQIGDALEKTGLLEKKLVQWEEQDQKDFAFGLREASKPIAIAANKCDIPSAEKNILRLKENFSNLMIIPCSGFAELALKKAAKQGLIEYDAGNAKFSKKMDLSEKQAQVLDAIQKMVLDKYGSSGIQEVLEKTVFGLLKYFAVFPAGVHKLQDSEGRVLPDVFLLPPNSTALDFAFKLHTAMGQGFIRAIDVKTKQAVGKEHPLKHRDAIEIIFKG
jgi:ribosome-binding ATPase YchF (GTP1/OBG family)